MKNTAIAVVLIFSCCLFSQPCFAASTAIIGTGGKTGVYYPVGKAICAKVNLRTSRYGFRYKSKESYGSVSNIKAVLNGNIELGLAQSDRHYEAYNGLTEWRSTGPQKDLRSVFSIYSEVITLVASRKSNIQSLEGIKGKRVNIGHRGSGQHRNSIDVLKSANIGLAGIIAKQTKAVGNQKLLQNDKIDAFFYTVGHPNKMIKDISGKIDISIIPITGPGIDSLIRKYPYYTRSQIPAYLYPFASHRGDINSVGLKATLITSRKVSNHVIYSLVKEVFEHLHEIKASHPALKNLTKKEMLKGLSAPIHEGALLYYREAGLI